MPELPAVSRTTALNEAVAAAFSDDGALSRAVDGYEAREGQRQMASAVANCIEHGGTSSLKPAPVPARRSRTDPGHPQSSARLVYTGTKTSRNRSSSRISLAARSVERTLHRTLMKGRSNYCASIARDVQRWRRGNTRQAAD